MMKRTFLPVLLFLISSLYAAANDYTLNSPDNKISVKISVGKDLTWNISYQGKEIARSQKTGLFLADGRVLGEDEKVKRAAAGKINEIIKPVVSNKRSAIPNVCNTLTLSLGSGLSIQFRAYNDGVAYRFETTFKDKLTIKDELADIVFPAGSHSWYPLETSFMSHNERTFIYSALDTISGKHLASLPTLFQTGGIDILMTESDIDDYPGMWIRGGGSGKITGTWSKYPDTEKLEGELNLFITSSKDYIAQTAGTRTFPWRVFIIEPSDVKLLENDLVFRLAPENRIADTKWIKPGHVAWDWWNANNIYGVDFRAGINTNTYKYYIDFASKNNLEYIIVDDGWYYKGDILKPIPDMDVAELCRYAETKNVGVILWVPWKSFWDRMEETTSQYEKWGVKGVKVDFMQRDDQKVVNFYHEAVRKTAEHHLLIDFHGAYKPDGISRTWPNNLTREGVKGLENDKWSRDINPDHDATIPFTRMVAGPMDYTPGAMVNMDKANFTPNYTRPESQGTRAHQVALYVLYESPLQMLADSPSNYMKEQETTSFIAHIPVVWDDIVGIDGKVGDYLIVARRSGSDWFVGAITDWTPRDFELDLSFLPAGNYSLEIFQDGINADRYAGDYKHIISRAKSGDKIKLHLAPGGGWVARIVPE